jgi:spore coat polysaccharide biosynthesis protein SpsF
MSAGPLVIIQAREASTRLPRKIHADIEGLSMLLRVCQRVALSGLPFVVAMPQPGDNEDDVLSRYVRVCRRSPDYDPLIRVTADCPLWDHTVAGYALNQYRTLAVDYVGTRPDMDGLDVEVFSRAALLTADLGTHGRAREHVTPWLRRNLRAHTFTWAPAPLRWSVDDQSGLDFVREVYRSCVHCANGVSHHTNAPDSIGGPDRILVVDLHQMTHGGLEECAAADILKTRMGGEVYTR